MAETIGSLVDKVCIAELKIFHMREQVERPDASSDRNIPEVVPRSADGTNLAAVASCASLGVSAKVE